MLCVVNNDKFIEYLWNLWIVPNEAHLQYFMC
jgi:hypothetical protein